MHGKIDRIIQHRLLKFLRKEPLATDFSERCIQDAISLRRQLMQLHAAGRMLLFNGLRHIVRLPQSQLARSCTDSDCAAVHWFLSLPSHLT